jgi:hypothetical protein
MGIEGAAYLRYADAKALTVPLRSSIVRDVLEVGGKAAEGFAPVYAFGILAAGAIAEGRALAHGKCQ